MLRVGKCCRCALINVTRNSRAINCTESPLNLCLLRVSSSHEPEWRFRPLLGQSESDSPIELVCRPRHVNTSIIMNQIDDKYLKWGLIFNFYKRLLLNLRDQELITCSQILNRILTMCSDKTLNYDCSKVSH